MQLKVTTPKHYGGKYHQFVFEVNENGEEVKAHDFVADTAQESRDLAYAYLEAYK